VHKLFDLKKFFTEKIFPELHNYGLRAFLSVCQVKLFVGKPGMRQIFSKQQDLAFLNTLDAGAYEIGTLSPYAIKKLYFRVVMPRRAKGSVGLDNQ
jgi:hypothetical protein